MTVSRIVLCVPLFALSACSGSLTQNGPSGHLYLTGYVASVRHSATGSGVLIEPPPGSGIRCGIQAVADAQTRYFQRTPFGGLTALGTGAAGSIDEGDRVEVYVDGPIAESCPVQGRASAFVVVGRASG